MTDEEKIEKALVSLIDSRIPVQTLPAQITAVDAEKGTCDVEFMDKDLAPHKGVHLNAGLSTSKGFLQVPKLNSFVYISIVQNDEQWAFVSLFTELDEIRLRGNKLGGLVKINELKKQLAKNMARIDFILEVLKTTITSVSLQPNPAWASIITPLIQALQKEDYSDIENDKVNHG